MWPWVILLLRTTASLSAALPNGHHGHGALEVLEDETPVRRDARFHLAGRKKGKTKNVDRSRPYPQIADFLSFRFMPFGGVKFRILDPTEVTALSARCDGRERGPFILPGYSEIAAFQLKSENASVEDPVTGKLVPLGFLLEVYGFPTDALAERNAAHQEKSGCWVEKGHGVAYLQVRSYSLRVASTAPDDVLVWALEEAARGIEFFFAGGKKRTITAH